MGERFVAKAQNGAVRNDVSGILQTPTAGSYPLTLTVSEWGSEQNHVSGTTNFKLQLDRPQSAGPIFTFLYLRTVTLSRLKIETKSGSASPEKAAEDYCRALQEHDVTKIRSLVHPATLGCINSQNRSVFDMIFAEENRFFGPNARLRVMKVNSLANKDAVGVKELPADLFYFPFKPTHGFQIDNEGSSDTMVRDIAPANGSWYVLLPCPTPKGIAFIRSRSKR